MKPPKLSPQNPNISPKQAEVLTLLLRYRFLNTNQIYKLLNHKSPRRVQEWLKDLTEKGYIHKDFSRDTFTGSTRPAVYSLVPKSIQVLKKQKDYELKLLRKIYQEDKRSDKFKEHCLFIADIHLKSRENYNGQVNTLHFSPKNDLAKYDYFPENLPDAYIAIKEDNNKTNKKQITRRYLLELIDEKVPRFAIRSKVTKYFDYYTDNIWESATQSPFPEILVICPNILTKIYIDKFIRKILEGRKIKFYLTTKDQIKNEGITNEI